MNDSPHTIKTPTRHCVSTALYTPIDHAFTWSIGRALRLIAPDLLLSTY